MPSSRLVAALGAIDAANTEDPTVVRVGDREGPKELLHAQAVTEWVQRLDADADELQLLAARAHHFRRWTRPRGDYPDGRAGYLRWRRDAQRAHATEVAAVLVGGGYGPEEVERVQALIRKRGLGADPAAQVHEDALCLVFLETQLDELVARLGVDKAVDVLVRTARKMSAVGLEHARSLPLSAEGRTAVELALAPDA